MAIYAVDRDSMRLMFAIAANCGMEVYHLDLASAFLHEEYQGPQPLYMYPPTNFDGSARQLGKVAVIMKKNFGTPHKPLIYVYGLRKHLHKYGYAQLRADRCI